MCGVLKGYGSIEEAGVALGLLELLKRPILAVQDFYILAGQAVRNVLRKPHYGDDIYLQMDLRSEERRVGKECRL